MEYGRWNYSHAFEILCEIFTTFVHLFFNLPKSFTAKTSLMPRRVVGLLNSHYGLSVTKEQRDLGSVAFRRVRIC